MLLPIFVPVPHRIAGYTPNIRPLARTLLAGVLAACVLNACSDDPDPDGPQSKGVDDVGAGQCLQVDETLDAEVSDLPVIDCTKPHTHEIFHTVEDDESDVYPGLSSLELFAQKECYSEFEGFVGISPFDSDLYITWIVPSLDGWNDEDDREVLCVLARRDDGQLETSAKDLQI